MQVFTESYENGKLPESQRKSVFSLIQRKDREDDINNYRLISLTKVDYRILAFAFVVCMHKVLHCKY